MMNIIRKIVPVILQVQIFLQGIHRQHGMYSTISSPSTAELHQYNSGEHISLLMGLQQDESYLHKFETKAHCQAHILSDAYLAIWATNLYMAAIAIC
jgi:hypothetical protein